MSDEQKPAEPPKPEPILPDPNERIAAIQIVDGVIVLAIFDMQASEQNGMVSIHDQTPIMTLNLDAFAADSVAAALKSATSTIKGLIQAEGKEGEHYDQLRSELEKKILETKVIPRRIGRHKTLRKGERYSIITEDKS